MRKKKLLHKKCVSNAGTVIPHVRTIFMRMTQGQRYGGGRRKAMHLQLSARRCVNTKRVHAAPRTVLFYSVYE